MTFLLGLGQLYAAEQRGVGVAYYIGLLFHADRQPDLTRTVGYIRVVEGESFAPDDGITYTLRLEGGRRCSVQLITGRSDTPNSRLYELLFLSISDAPSSCTFLTIPAPKRTNGLASLLFL
ncbi:MAG: hypothetical protein IPK16_31730 [Anaerolineales bacterium]|nr:hypothetical protein [Anaerolineales bacterium]